MDGNTSAPVRYAPYSWANLLKALCFADTRLHLPLLETILFDPSTSKVDLWVSTDHRGYIKSIDKQSLLKSDLLTTCLKTILTPAEQDLYANEVQLLISSNDSMFPFNDRKACFLLFRDGRRRLIRLSALLRFLYYPEKLVTGQVVGLQVYPLSTDIRKEFMYVVSVQSLPEGQFALQLHKVWYKWKFPDHIMSQEQLPASDLELKLVKASRDVIRLIEGKLDTEIRDMQLLFMQDFHGNSVKLAGTQQTYLREAPPTKEKLFKLIPQSSMRKTRSYSTALRLHSRVESPLRPISTIIRPKLRAKPRKLPVIGKPSPLTRQLVVKPPRKLPEVGDNTPPEPEKHRSLMVDQEAQAQTWETVDSTEASHLRLNPSSMFPNWSYYKGPGSHLQTVNSTISLPEPDSLPRSSVIRLGDLKNPNRVRGRAQSTLRSSPV